MAEDKRTSEKSIEMRLAELEDKIARIHITEEELKAYHKVSALIAGQGLGAQGAAEAQLDPNAALSPTICYIRPVARIVPRIFPRIVNECTCGPCACAQLGGGGFGGGFGTFGM